MLFFAITLLFFGLCNGLILNCTYHTHAWPGLGNIYWCDAIVVRLNGGKDVTGVTQNHARGRSNDDVKLIHFTNQPIDFLPREINKRFKNIQALRMVNTNLKYISKFDLQQFPDLRHIRLGGNPIEEIESDLFSSTPRVHYIEFDYNRIKNVGSNLFRNLSEIFTVHFIENPCIDASAGGGIHAIAKLSVLLAQKCPPTAGMIVRMIEGNEANLVPQIDDRINLYSDKIVKPAFALTNGNVEKLRTHVNETFEENQAGIRRLQNRVAALEEMIMGTISWK
jgi:hypothetical protein